MKIREAAKKLGITCDEVRSHLYWGAIPELTESGVQLYLSWRNTNYCSPTEAARYLHITPADVLTLLLQGRLNYMREGGRLYILYNSLDPKACSSLPVSRGTPYTLSAVQELLWLTDTQIARYLQSGAIEVDKDGYVTSAGFNKFIRFIYTGLTTSKAAHDLGCSTSTVRRYLRKEVLTGHLVGNRYILYRDPVDRLSVIRS